VRRMVESKDSFSMGFLLGGGVEGWGLVSVGSTPAPAMALAICSSSPAVSFKMALSRSSGLTPCFSMFLVKSSNSLPMADMSSADAEAEAFGAVGSGFRFPRTDDISAARRAMKSSSDSAG
jgi:hypothetical protein